MITEEIKLSIDFYKNQIEMHKSEIERCELRLNELKEIANEGDIYDSNWKLPRKIKYFLGIYNDKTCREIAELIHEKEGDKLGFIRGMVTSYFSNKENKSQFIVNRNNIRGIIWKY